MKTLNRKFETTEKYEEEIDDLIAEFASATITPGKGNCWLLVIDGDEPTVDAFEDVEDAAAFVDNLACYYTSDEVDVAEWYKVEDADDDERPTYVAIIRW